METTKMRSEDNTRPNTDENLALQFQTNKDLSAVEELIGRHQNMAYRAALACTRNAALAEDAVQEAFMSFTQGRSKFTPQGPGTFRGWLYCVVRNHAKMLLRKEGGRRRRVGSRRYCEQAMELAADRQRSPVEVFTAENAEISRTLNAALRSLQDELREPLTLHYVEGFSQDEISRLLGVSQNVIQRRLVRGLELLRIRMTQSGVALSVATLPASFAHAAPMAPTALTETLKRIASDPRSFTSATVSQSVRAAGTFASTKAVLATTGLVLCVVIGGVWWWSQTRPTDGLGKIGIQTPADTTPMTNAKTEKFYRQWSFKDGPIHDLKVIQGDWRWERDTDGVGRMVLAPGHKSVMFLVPKPLPRRPMLLTLCGSKTMPGTRFFGACWAMQDKTLPLKIWKGEHVPQLSPNTRRFTYNCFLVGKYVVTTYGANNAPTGIVECQSEYPGITILVQSTGIPLEWIELRELDDKEAENALRLAQEGLARAKTRGDKPVEYTEQPFAALNDGK